jgi:hypothetical protein
MYGAGGSGVVNTSPERRAWQRRATMCTKRTMDNCGLA